MLLLDILAKPKLRCLLPWAFLHVLDSETRAQYPPLPEDGSLKASVDIREVVALPAGTIAARIDSAIDYGDDGEKPSVQPAPLLCVTFNPQTLRPMCKRDSFVVQRGSMRAHMIGYQKARFRHTELKLIPDSPFIQATSACTSHGRGGCAMWFNTAIPWVAVLPLLMTLPSCMLLLGYWFAIPLPSVSVAIAWSCMHRTWNRRLGGTM